MTDATTSSRAATFVTGLGWVLIVLTGFGLITSVMQNVMFSFVLPSVEEQVPVTEQMPHGFLIAFRVLVAFMLCVSAFLVFAAWSFLKRRNWARKTFVVVFALGAVWSAFVFLAVGLGFGVFDVFREPPSATGVPPSVQAAFRVMAIMFGTLAAGIGALFVWLIKRLRSSDVRAEFAAR
jgi:uncharacterized membrane protein YozB (DUF420 family)